MCAAGIHLAYPHIVLSQGLVMRYAYRQPSLGLVASAAVRQTDGTATEMPNLCADVLVGPEKTLFLSKAFAAETALGSDELAEQRPINADYLRDGVQQQRLIKNGEVTPEIVALKARPVFLGSQFDARDEFLTPYGPFKGVVIHAATFYSERNPTHAIAHHVAVFVDLLFGAVGGFLFGAIWQRTNAAATELEAGGASIGRWLVARGWLLAAFGILVLWLTMLFYGSAWLLTHDLWNNPGPMIVGVFVKTLLASRVGFHGRVHDGDHTDKNSFKKTFLNNLDWLVLSPIVIWAAFIFMGH